MLEPGKRLLYLEELRPPEGYQLDRAIATTFSLDLLSLLMAPLSMVLHESQSRDEFLRNPMAALEAIRRSAGDWCILSKRAHQRAKTATAPLPLSGTQRGPGKATGGERRFSS